MCLDDLALMPGILAKHGWGNFQIDEEGALALRQKTLPPDLSEQVAKAVRDLTSIFMKAFHAYEAMWPLCGVGLHSESHLRHDRILTMSILLYHTGIGRIPSSKYLDNLHVTEYTRM